MSARRWRRTDRSQAGAASHNRTLAWVATYRNRPKILELTLKAGGDCNTPACDPMHATMACDVVQMGTGVAVTPLAIAKKWQPALVAPLVEHGAIDDVFTAAWLGDLPALRGHVDRNPELVNAIDPVGRLPGSLAAVPRRLRRQHRRRASCSSNAAPR